MKLENFVVTKFDTSSDDLVEKLPYVLENTETKERQIGVLKNSADDMLAFSTWRGVIVITPADAEKYNIYKADLTDGMYLLFKNDTLSISASHDMPEEKMKQIKDAMSEEGVVQAADLNQIFDNVHVSDVVETPPSKPKRSIMCYRELDGGHWMRDKNKAYTIGIKQFYTVSDDVTIIHQFLYRVSGDRRGYDGWIKYEIVLTVSEYSKKYYMNKGFKIHPMFYNAQNGCYMPSVHIQRSVKKYSSEYNKNDSITLQILSGLQLLHLIEYGANEKDKEDPGMYAGIHYTDKGFIVSNVFIDEGNHLVIDNDRLLIVIKDKTGYISEFKYCGKEYDWLLFPEETSEKPRLSDSYFMGPTMGMKNIIKWGDDSSESFGMFHYWMQSTDPSDDDYIIPWEFGGE